ncbi:MAG: hypothetical protein ABI780_12025 [Ardenticatenales bacterium]
MTPEALQVLRHLARQGYAGALIIPGSATGVAAGALVDVGYAAVGGRVWDADGRLTYRVRVTEAGEAEALRLAGGSAAAA